MAIQKYHMSKNLVNISDFTYTAGSGSYNRPLWTGTLPTGTYTVSINQDNDLTSSTRNTLIVSVNGVAKYESSATNYHNSAGLHTMAFSVNTGDTIAINYWAHTLSNNCTFSKAMLNIGETALPFEPYYTPYFEEIGYKKYESATDNITTLPADIIADGQSASADIIGNMVQTGTPSPQSIIIPSECGDKTANLFDKNATNTTNGYINNYYLLSTGNTTANSQLAVSVYIPVEPNGTYTLSFSRDIGNSPSLCLYDNSKTYITGYSYNGQSAVTFTTTQDTAYIRISIHKTYIDSFMLNTGSTPLPYQPYGYKIPILSGGTTTPVYLGEVQSERNIYKLVLTGGENWYFSTYPYINGFLTNFPHYLRQKINTCVCSHLQTSTNVQSGEPVVSDTCCFNVESPGGVFYYKDTSVSDLASFKSWLQQQYNNGTPVTVWYVLATPTTGILNEPIRKIGNYSDSVSVTGIPTTGTAESFDVDTTLKPSEIDLTYHGWHEHTDTKFED